MPKLSKHFQSREPSAIRKAQIIYMDRTDGVKAINTAIGNVSLPIHPAMKTRMDELTKSGSPFEKGQVMYSATIGYPETNQAFKNIIAASGFNTDKIYSQITNGGSEAMELVITGVCGPAGTDEDPLLLIDAAYTNYNSFASRLGRKTVSVRRTLNEDGKFSLPNMDEIEKTIQKHKPNAMVIIPYDNPTGHFYDHDTFVKLAKLCVKNDMWIISDEAYRELHYTNDDVSSIWGLTEEEVPGIEGRLISIETSSKVWNACGLRIGALVTDNEEFHTKAVFENTAGLCSNVLGQYIFGALAHESKESLQEWFQDQRDHYKPMLFELTKNLKELLPGVIVSSPDASIYSVVDVKNIAKEGFDSADFVKYCAEQGKFNINGEDMTLLVSPMTGFYSTEPGEENPGKTQMRIAYVPPKEEMKLVPKIFSELFKQYNEKI